MGQQISSQHEWFPQNVIGTSGLRSLQPTHNKVLLKGNGSFDVSREGVKGSAPFASLFDTHICDGEVNNEEWKVEQGFARL